MPDQQEERQIVLDYLEFRGITPPQGVTVTLSSGNQDVEVVV